MAFYFDWKFTRKYKALEEIREKYDFLFFWFLLIFSFLRRRTIATSVEGSQFFMLSLWRVKRQLQTLFVASFSICSIAITSINQKKAENSNQYIIRANFSLRSFRGTGFIDRIMCNSMKWAHNVFVLKIVNGFSMNVWQLTKMLQHVVWYGMVFIFTCAPCSMRHYRHVLNWQRAQWE